MAALSDPQTSSETKKHLKALFGFSPATHISDVHSRMDTMYRLVNGYIYLHSFLGINNPFFSSSTMNFFKTTINFTCRLIPFLCQGILYMPGLSVQNNDKDLIPSFLTVLPGGSSFRCYQHFYQLSQIKSDQPVLRKYDFGIEENLERYGGEAPPDYDYSLIDTPIYIHSGREDTIITPQSINRFTSHMKRMGKHIETEVHENWDHFSILMSQNPEIVFESILEQLERNK